MVPCVLCCEIITVPYGTVLGGQGEQEPGMGRAKSQRYVYRTNTKIDICPDSPPACVAVNGKGFISSSSY
jgi:hypothetical protein